MTAPLIYFIIILLDGHWTGVYRVGHVPQFGKQGQQLSSFTDMNTKTDHYYYHFLKLKGSNVKICIYLIEF